MIDRLAASPLVLASLALGILTLALTPLTARAGDKPALPPALDFTVKTIDGKDICLAETYKGKVVLIVNVASKCGHTPQYKDLQKLYETYKDKGLVVLGFPANDFGRQEPGSDEQIKAFCETTFGVTFDMFSKIVVKGEGQHPLYQYLTEEKTNPKFAGPVKWNFEKFLIGRDGEVIGRFRSGVKPMSAEMVKAVEDALAAS